MISPGGTPSPNLDYEPTQEEMMRSMMDIRDDQDRRSRSPKTSRCARSEPPESENAGGATAGDLVDRMS